MVAEFGINPRKVKQDADCTMKPGTSAMKMGRCLGCTGQSSASRKAVCMAQRDEMSFGLGILRRFAPLSDQGRHHMFDTSQRSIVAGEADARFRHLDVVGPLRRMLRRCRLLSDMQLSPGKHEGIMKVISGINHPCHQSICILGGGERFRWYCHHHSLHGGVKHCHAAAKDGFIPHTQLI